jgi:hypothetical protein
MTAALHARADSLASELLEVASSTCADKRLAALAMCAAACMLMARALTQAGLSAEATEALLRDFKLSFTGHLDGLVRQVTGEIAMLDALPDDETRH